MKKGDAPIVIKKDGKHLDAVAGSYLAWRPTRCVDPPQMTAIDVALVGRKDDEGFVLRKRDVFNFKISRRQGLDSSAFGRNRIDVNPSVCLRWKLEPIVRCPLPEVSRARI